MFIPRPVNFLSLIMPSLIPGCEYDIFISYRQNDNRSGWVTRFVKSLQEELGSTIKDPVSVYFDANPHDGLLETYDVDKSLEGKLKCLIFIPILSQTYCDTKSFAWQHEFCAFNKLAKEDEFGRDIKLLNGNVTSRILPVKIHDLDTEDKNILEHELGGILRDIEFIYKEPGVNRPLKVDDQEKKNLSGTKYRNQVNKVANAVKEIIAAIKSPANITPVPKETFVRPSNKQKTISKKRISLIAIGLVILSALVYGVSQFIGSTNEEKETLDRSIAVLPFVNMSNDPDQEYFSDGLSEELLNLLSKIPELKVIGRTSSFSFKGKNEDLRIIGEKLGVAHILEGRVQKDGNKVRVTAQLIRVDDGIHLWSEKYDRDMEGIFKLQDEIAGAVVNQLKLKLLVPSKVSSSPINTEVYNFILQGNYFAAKRTEESLAKALDFYLQALAIDSLNARTWAALAECYELQGGWGWIDRSEGYEKARKAATKSIELDNSNAEGHRMLGVVKMYYDLDWNGAAAEYQKALNIEVRNAEVMRMISILYRCTGRVDDGIRLSRQSITLDPVKAVSYYNLGQLLYYADSLDGAIECYKKTLELNPEFPRVYVFIGKAYLLQGKPDLALSVMQQEVDKTWRSFGMILTYHALGRKQEVEKLMSDFLMNLQEDHMYLLAEIYAYQGEKDKAFDWLEKTYSARASRISYFKGDPLLKKLEGDPRHNAFLKRMNSSEWSKH
jgi:TolB-like protein